MSWSRNLDPAFQARTNSDGREQDLKRLILIIYIYSGLLGMTAGFGSSRIPLCIAGMILDGFQRSNEPFLISLLQLGRAWSNKYPKEKARTTIGGGALDLPHFTTPGSKTQASPMVVPNPSETSPKPRRRSQAGADTGPTARPPASTKVRPSLPVFLRDQTVGDAGAAARAQYGGEVLAPLTNK